MFRTSEIVADLAEALAKAQVELVNPDKTKTAKITANQTYKYADLADVLSAARPILGKHGLSIIQPTVINDRGSMLIVTRLMHSTGQWLECDYPVAQVGADHKAMGAALTYARRYALSSLIGLAAEEDSDGEGAPPTGERPQPQERPQAQRGQRPQQSAAEKQEPYEPAKMPRGPFIPVPQGNLANDTKAWKSWQKALIQKFHRAATQEEIDAIESGNSEGIIRSEDFIADARAGFAEFITACREGLTKADEQRAEGEEAAQAMASKEPPLQEGQTEDLNDEIPF